MIFSQTRIERFNDYIPNILVFLFFLIPPLVILGPFFPDLIISLTVVYTLIISIKDKKKFYFEIIKKDPFVKFLLFFYLSFFNSIINFLINNNFIYTDFKIIFLELCFYLDLFLSSLNNLLNSKI